MSRLEELLRELCPNGVEYKKLGDIGQFYGGLTGKSKDDFKEGNKAFITYKNVYANPALDIEPIETVKIKENEKQRTLEYGDIIFTGSSETPDECGMSAVVTKEPTQELYLNSFCFFLRLHDKNLLLPDFAKHIFRSHELRRQLGRTASGVTRFNVSKDKMARVTIPVPPLAVQREIVHILDNFTLLTAELTAELTARKKQYEYYRDELLHLDGERITIQDLFDTRNGFTPSKDNPAFWEAGNLPWFKLDDINDKGRVLSDSYLHITSKALKKSGLFSKNSIIISTSATIGEYALITVPFLCNQRFTCMTVKPKYTSKVNIKYLMHYCPILSKYCKEHLNQGNFASVDMKKFVKFEFVIPSIEEQERIVAILDRFDALCNDISIGLPAEIEARQKQYEYYRDKLLTFERLA